MPDAVLIIGTVGAIVVALARQLPSIVWAFRCPKDSPHYKHPPVVRLASLLPWLKG
jgi:hypothetical protein